MRRFRVAAFAALTLACAEARASSFIVLAPLEPGDAISIVELGDPVVIAAPPDRDIKTSSYDRAQRRPAAPFPEVFGAAWPQPRSPSFVTFGTPPPPEPMPAAAGPAVAARPAVLPMVIRGGLAGEAFPSGPAGGPVAPLDPAPAIQPRQGAEAAYGGEERLSRRERRREERSAPEPEPALLPPAPPTGQPM